MMYLQMKLREEGRYLHKLWVPGHVGISGNKKADHLAKAGYLSKNIIHNQSYSWKNMVNNMRLIIKKDIITDLTTRTDSKERINQTGRTQLGPLPWHLETPIGIFRKLQRLRRGHNKISYIMSRIDDSVFPRCLNCNVNNTVEHIMIDCSMYKKERETLKLKLTSIQQPFSLRIILGLQKDITLALQKTIQNALITFLKETEILNKL